MEPNITAPHTSAFDADESGSLDSFCCGEPRGRCYTWPVQQQPPQFIQIDQQHHQIGSTLIGPSCSSRLPSLNSLSPSSGLILPPPQQCHQNDVQYAKTEETSPPKPSKPKRIRRRTDGNGATILGGTGKKPNPWGDESYSDLIARALSTAQEGRLKLNEIYQWFSDNVPYFGGRSSQEEAQGWKNSIRHNLSLHSRFMRIQNEGAGKSSWWVINPDAKPGRNPRRRANTMESASKVAMDKKRRGARKRVEQMVQQKGQPGVANSLMGSMQALFPDEAHEDAGEMMPGPSGAGGNFDTFRPRAQSTLSVTGPSRLSPKLESTCLDDIDFPPWMDQSNGSTATNQQPPQQSQQQVNELLDRTDQMRLDGQQQSGPPPPLMNGIKIEPIGGPLLMPKSEILDPGQIKLEPSQPTSSTATSSIPPPPSYQELSAVRRSVQIQSNPLLRQLGGSPQQQMMSPLNLNAASSLSGVQQQSSSIFTSQSMVPPPPFGQNNFQWNGAMPPAPVTSGGPLLMAHSQFIVGQSGPLHPGGQLNGMVGGDGLPLDLANVNDDQSMFTDLDVDAVLRHELAQGGQFDLP